MYSQRPIVKPVSKIDNFLDSLAKKHEDGKPDAVFVDRPFVVPEIPEFGGKVTDLELYEAMKAENQNRGLIGYRTTSQDDLINQYEHLNPPIYQDWVNHENRLYQGRQPPPTPIHDQVDLIRQSNASFTKERNIYSSFFK